MKNNLLSCLALLCISQPGLAAPQHLSKQDEAIMRQKAQAEAELKKFQTEVRQGNESAALSLIDQMADSHVHPATASLTEAANFIIGRKQWQLAKRFMEKFPQAEPGWAYVFVNHWADESGTDPGRLSKIDAWMKDRSPGNTHFWVDQRFLFAQKTGRENLLCDEFEKQIEQTPDDMELARGYLNGLSLIRSKRDISALTAHLRPRLAFDNYRLAESLARQYPKEAIVFLERARSMPFTQPDQDKVTQYMRHLAMASRPDNKALLFSQWTRTMLVDCYKRTGANEKAQALLVDLMKEQGGKFPSYALTTTAGQIQSGTPLKPLEQEIKKAEPANENSVDYWCGRADYYRGRKDLRQEREALNKALKLSELGTPTNSQAVFVRSMVMSDYARFLAKNEGEAIAVNFLWGEFDKNPDTQYRGRILHDILESFERDNTHLLKPTDQRLWSFLTKSQWDDYGLQERLVWRMARNASTPQELNAFWQRAEAIASGAPTREMEVGWVMNRCQEPKRSLPILKAAIQHGDAKQKQHAYFTLFESYLDLCDWKNGETIFPEARKQLTANETPDWLGRLAIAAAKSGARRDALRLWREKDKIDLGALGHLAELKKLGMQPELVAYYEQLKRTKPFSNVPNEALAILK